MKKGRRRTADAGVVGGSGAGLGKVKERVADLGLAGGMKDAFGKVKSAVLQYSDVLLRIILPVVYCLLFGGTGYPMGIYPFGISAVCAAVSGGPALMAAAAAAVSSMFVRGGFYIAAVCAAAAGALATVRKLRGDGAESVTLRAALSLLMGASQAVLFALPDGISFYELCGILLASVLGPVFTVGLRGLFRGEAGTGFMKEAGVLVLMYTAAYFLRMLSPAGASVAIVLSMMAVLVTSYSFGIHRGVLVGIALGLAADFRYSVIYAVAAAGSGVLMGISPMAAVVAGVLLALAFGLGSGGASAFGELFPEFAFAAAVAGPLIHYGVIPIYGRGRAVTVAEADPGEERVKGLKKRLKALSASLSSVSAAMGKLSRVMVRPSVQELRQMCDEAFDESCVRCGNRDICWGREYRSTAASLGTMAAALHRGGAVDAGYFPEGVRDRCRDADGILMRINTGASAAVRDAEAADCTGVCADDYAAMSKLLGELSDDGGDTDFDSDASEELKERLRLLGLRSAEVSVYGKRRRHAVIRGLERGCSVGGEELRNAAESVLGCRMSVPEYRIDGSRVTAELHTAERFRVRFGRCSVAKKGERCGDSVTSFRGDGGYFYTLISDGMGSGTTAAMTSGISAVFLERMLGAGCSLGTAMEMLNSFLVRRRVECFTTVDLMEADLITGELAFVKSGAAPSFVLREGRLFRLASKTVPVGIVTPFDAERIRFDVRDGDFVVMLSDGVLPDGADGGWLYELLSGGGGDGLLSVGCDLDSAAAVIAKTAAKEYGYGDDVTVGVVEVRGV